MTLESAINEYPDTWTHGQVLDALRERTIDQPGVIKGAILSGILMSFGLLSLVARKAKAAEVDDNSVLANISYGLSDRFKPNGEVDFSESSNFALIDRFLSEPEVVAVLTAQGFDGAMVKAEIVRQCTRSVLEFPAVNMRDVIEVREPALLSESVSNFVDVIARPGGNADFRVVIGVVPEPVTPMVEVQHVINDKTTEWRGSAIGGFGNLPAAGDYLLRVPGSLISNHSRIRVKMPYNVSVSIERV